MAVQQCNACDFITEYSVSYVATDTEVTLTLVDACCRVKSCKMKKAILAKAYCDLRALLADPEASEAYAPAGHGGCESEALSYVNAEWTFGSSTAVFAGDFSELAESEDTIQVAVPVHFVS